MSVDKKASVVMLAPEAGLFRGLSGKRYRADFRGQELRIIPADVAELERLGFRQLIRGQRLSEIANVAGRSGSEELLRKGLAAQRMHIGAATIDGAINHQVRDQLQRCHATSN
jgi:hypothetical protein